METKKTYERLLITFQTMTEQSVLAASGPSDNDGNWLWGDQVL